LDQVTALVGEVILKIALPEQRLETALVGVRSDAERRHRSLHDAPGGGGQGSVREWTTGPVKSLFYKLRRWRLTNKLVSVVRLGRSHSIG
jgi:tRNA G37 N-methylase TrmD